MSETTKGLMQIPDELRQALGTYLKGQPDCIPEKNRWCCR